MYDSVRAKFRVLSLTHSHDGYAVAVLRPVMPRRRGEPVLPETAEENAAFFAATPSGELELRYARADLPLDLVVGAYAYVNLQPCAEKFASPRAAADAGAWKLWSITWAETEIEVKFGLTWTTGVPCSGDLRMQVSNRDAWPIFMRRIESPDEFCYWYVRVTPC